jgi:predicted AAA+ superfamily ATPase
LPRAPGTESPWFENVVALHLLKLVDAWNDLGHGDCALHYVRDKEKREVDFFVTERRRPFLLVEAKLDGPEPSAALRYFAERLSPRLAVQVVRHGQPRTSGAVRVIPADRFLALT